MYYYLDKDYNIYLYNKLFKFNLVYKQFSLNKSNYTFKSKQQQRVHLILSWFKLASGDIAPEIQQIPLLTTIYLQNYFYSLFNYKFYFRAINLIKIVKKYLFLLEVKLKKRYLPQKLELIYPQDVYKLFFCAFFYKDLFLLRNWIKHQFETKSIKLYKSLIYTIWSLVLNFGWYYKQFNQITGIHLYFKGKINKGGSRKQIIKFTKGDLK